MDLEARLTAKTKELETKKSELSHTGQELQSVKSELISHHNVHQTTLDYHKVEIEKARSKYNELF